MRKLLLLIIILLGSFVTYSQETLTEKEKAKRQRNLDAVNPFHKFGYKAKVATLSKGKYLEMFITDSIVQIASFHYNILTNKVTGFTQLDTLNSEATLRPDVVSRWINPDPLSEEFPDKSPYSFANNNPIYFIDPTGLAPQGWDDDYGIDKNGNIKLIKETNDKFDRLYRAKSDDKGNAVLDKNGMAQKDGNKNVKVNNQNLLSTLSLNMGDVDLGYFDNGSNYLSMSYALPKDKNDVFNIFKFSSDNSDAEWSVAKIQFEGGAELYNIGTYHNQEISPGASNTPKGTTVTGMVHSHPDIEKKNEIFSMSGHQITTRKVTHPYFTYFPITKSIYKQWYKKGRNAAQTKKVNSFKF